MYGLWGGRWPPAKYIWSATVRWGIKMAENTRKWAKNPDRSPLPTESPLLAATSPPQDPHVTWHTHVRKALSEGFPNIPHNPPLISYLEKVIHLLLENGTQSPQCVTVCTQSPLNYPKAEVVKVVGGSQKESKSAIFFEIPSLFWA